MTGTKKKEPNVALTAIVAILFFALVLWFAWNVGVVAIVAAAGGHVATITYWAALGGWLFVRLCFLAVTGLTRP